METANSSAAEGGASPSLLQCVWRSAAFDVTNIDAVARDFSRMLDWGDVVAIQAPMGTGKTTFVAALCRVFGAVDVASSPTFALCQEYPVAPVEGVPEPLLRHLDLYRIKDASELHDLGWEELMDDPAALTMIEWPERAADHFPDRAKLLRLERQPDGLRMASLWKRESV
jgi:tRNA threonylcarbamoyladenosine biosynthesis protein TsaE